MTLYRIWKTSGQYSQHKMNVIKLDVNAPVTRLKKQRHTRISTILWFTIQREDPGLQQDSALDWIRRTPTKWRSTHRVRW
jgi:hypothetical protein